MKKQLSLLLASTLLTTNIAVAAGNYNYSQTAQPQQYQYKQPQVQNFSSNKPLKGSVVVVPSGTFVPAATTMPLSSETLFLGQGVSMAVASDFFYNGKLIAPAGSTIAGTVVDVKKAKAGSMNGRLQIKFTQIITPYGVQIPIMGVIRTEDGSGTLIGGTKMDVTKAYAKDVAVGSAAGALSGLVFGALAGGSVGKGAALGTAVGAGGGLVKSVIDKGNNVEIPANAEVEILIMQPVTVNPSAYSYDY